MSRASNVALLVSAFLLSSFASAQAPMMQSSWPQAYPGMPTGDYSPAWQNYFQVTESLPNVSWPLARNWAGNIPVQRSGHPNDTLFFWAFEHSDGLFTANSTEPWAIWLNGGPGASSLIGLLFENGPIHISSNYSAVNNQYAWSSVADYVWIDQPVGTGFSTADANGYVPDEDQLGADFMGFLENFIKVFPNLATRPLYITGESYAGTYIPYITKAYFEANNPPVNLSAIAIGDGTITSVETFMQLPVITVLETYPQIIGYDVEVYGYFLEQSSLCGYNLTLQYPQPGHFPTLKAPLPLIDSPISSGIFNARITEERIKQDARERFATRPNERDDSSLVNDERLVARDVWKRGLTGLPNGTIDRWYQCDLYDEMVDYAVNFTFPWSSGKSFDAYDVPDALSPEAPMDASVFLNNAQTRAAIHAPTSKDWMEIIPFPFAPQSGSVNANGDPSVEPMAFLTDLATNATARGVKIVIYSGNDDSLVPHLGSQIAIQNTTFGGIQGFTRTPETPWYDDEGKFAGIVHQERGWTYVLVQSAGHLLGYNNPTSALVLVREFILGNNQTGLVTNTSSGQVTVVGGEVSSFGGEIMTGGGAIYYGQATTESSYFFPSATVDAWNAFMATASATARSGASSVLSVGSFGSGFCLASVLVIALEMWL